MLNDLSLERKRTKDRTREIFILCAFIISAALVSTVLMDLIIYPVAVFSLKNKAIFNFIVKYAFWIAVISAPLLVTIGRIRILRKDGFGIPEIMRHVGLRIAAVGASFMAVIAVACAVIALLYLLLNYNYYMLYKISNL